MAPVPSHSTFTDYSQSRSQAREMSPRKQHDLNLLLLELREKRMNEKLQQENIKRNQLIQTIKTKSQMIDPALTELSV